MKHKSDEEVKKEEKRGRKKEYLSGTYTSFGLRSLSKCFLSIFEWKCDLE